MSTTALRLIKKLRAAGLVLSGADDLYRIKRTHAGHNQRSAGAWSFTLEYPTFDSYESIRAQSIGSQWPASAILKSNFKIELTADRFGQIHIDPAGPIIASPTTGRGPSNF